MYSTCEKEHGADAGVCIEWMCLSSPLSLGLGRWQPGCCDNAKREKEGGMEDRGEMEGGREGGMRVEGSLLAKPGLSTNPLLPMAAVQAAVLQSQST